MKLKDLSQVNSIVTLINKKIGDCGTPTICEKLNTSDSLFSSIDTKADTAISNLNSIGASIENCAIPICTQLGTIGLNVNTIGTNVNDIKSHTGNIGACGNTTICDRLNTIGTNVSTIVTNVNCATPICTQLGTLNKDVTAIKTSVTNIGASIGNCGNKTICTRLGDLSWHKCY